MKNTALVGIVVVGLLALVLWLDYRRICRRAKRSESLLPGREGSSG